MRDFGWEYPPGVTGNEPQITGEWPCRVCEGLGYDDENEDGKHTCGWCHGSGIEPEEFTVEDVDYLATQVSYREAREIVAQAARDFDRHDPKTRAFLRECIEKVRYK